MQLRKESLKKFRLAGIWTLLSVIPVQHSNQLHQQAKWELVIKLACNVPGKDEDKNINNEYIDFSYIWTEMKK